MNSTWGGKIKISVFGESHGAAVGVVIDSIPAGNVIDFEKIKYQMRRRAPGKSNLETARREKDEFEILSGMQNNITTGAPIACIIRNTDTRSADYGELENVMRPGHSDYPAYIKYGGFNDKRGGGHFSARLTAPLVFAGSICRQLLENRGIKIYSHIYMINGIYDDEFDTVSPPDYTYLQDKELCVINDAQGAEMKEAVIAAKNCGDSVGGIVQAMVTGLPAGLGSHMFGSVESVVTSAVFAVPAVKGIEFGLGFRASKINGSENNDGFYIKNGAVKTYTNNCGGVLGGMTTGMPLVFSVAFKPTPTIFKEQKTVNMKTGENTVLMPHGRHDPCVAVRGAAVIEAVSALAAYELMQ